MTTVETDHVRNAHEHLRHDATSDPADEVRDHLRRDELAANRRLQNEQASQDQADQEQSQAA
jgi:hypothetical protein